MKKGNDTKWICMKLWLRKTLIWFVIILKLMAARKIMMRLIVMFSLCQIRWRRGQKLRNVSIRCSVSSLFWRSPLTSLRVLMSWPMKSRKLVIAEMVMAFLKWILWFVKIFVFGKIILLWVWMITRQITLNVWLMPIYWLITLGIVLSSLWMVFV